LFVIIVIHNVIHISQGSVETHLWCGGMYNNDIIANCLRSVTVKEFWKSVINWWRYGQKWSTTFFGPPCIIIHPVNSGWPPLLT